MSNFTQNLNDIVSIGPNLMKAIGIPKWFLFTWGSDYFNSGSVYFAIRGKKNDKI